MGRLFLLQDFDVVRIAQATCFCLGLFHASASVCNHVSEMKEP